MVYNIAHIGLLSPIKGITLFNRLTKDIAANWFIIGGLEEYEKYDWENVTVTGHYHSFDELWDLVDFYEIDFAVSLSMCPESFSYTLSECWKMGLPVIGTDLGAIGNRIRAIGGSTVDPYDYDRVVNLIKHIDPESIPIGEINYIEKMIADYEELYVRLIS